MEKHIVPDFSAINVLAAVIIACAYILLSSLIKEPSRQKFSAIMVGGAGAVYLSGGLGYWEFPFCTLMVYIAFKGLDKYYFIGIGWLLHTCWDVMHHLYGNPIVPFSASSSAGCAVCDALIAIWFFFGAPNVFNRFRNKMQPTVAR